MTASRPIQDPFEQREAMREKFDAAIREIHALDWTPDQAYSLQGRPVRYVSTAKIKRQVTPVLDKHGLRIAVTMGDAPILDGNLAVVRYRVSITNGLEEYQPATIYAEGVSAPGKRVIVSSTQAYRIYALSNLAIIDGMEDEAPSQAQSSEPPFVPIREGQPSQQAQPSEQASPDQPSGILRRTVTSAFRSVLASPSVPEDVRKEARDRYDRIKSDADAKAFLEWKKGICP